MDRFFPLLLLISFVAFSCVDETEDLQLDFGYEYFPLQVGQYRVYQVDSITYDPMALGTRVDTTTSFLREIVADTFIDLTGVVNYRVERFSRQRVDQDWQIDKVFSLSINESQALWQEDNLKYIKMVFPPKEGKTWDGNAFFNDDLVVAVASEGIEMFKGWSYQITELGAAKEVDGISFPEVIVVENANTENLIEYRNVLEQYAKGVGLIYREVHILDTQCRVCCDTDFALCESLPWEEKAEIGFSVIQKIIDYN